MNNPFLFDSDEPLRPREEVVITSLTVEPFPDGKRVRLRLQISPFEERPNLEIYTQQIDGPVVTEMSVIEIMTPYLEFTLHIRGVTATSGNYRLVVELFYDDRKTPQDKKEVFFQIRQFE